MNKHTLGSWECVHIDKRKQLYTARIIAKPSQLEIAEVFSLNYDELIANARLIAAAPELEDALWAMTNAARQLSVLHNDSESDEIDYAHETYKKAEQMFHNVINKIKG